MSFDKNEKKKDLTAGGVFCFDVSHLGQITTDHLFAVYDRDLKRADISMICMICMNYLMFSGGSRVTCMILDMSLGLDLYYADPAQHL